MTRQQIILGICIVATLSTSPFVFMCRPKPVTINNALDSVKAPLQRANDSLLNENRNLELRNGLNENLIDKLNSQLLQSDQNITKIKSRNNEKVNAIDKFRPSDIDSFITNRYGR